MSTFRYEGKNKESKTHKGVLQARSEEEAYNKLKEKGIYAYKLVEDTKAEGVHKKLKPIEISEFSRNIGSMQASGISIVRALVIMQEREENKKLKELYKALYDTVNQGNNLSTAMEECGSAFPSLLINMYRSGEVSGKLDQVAFKMAEYYEKEYKMNTKIKNAMTYPILLLGGIVAAVIIMFTFILPKFFAVFEGLELPLITQIFIAISNALVYNWPVILGGTLIVGVVGYFIFTRDQVTLKMDQKKLGIPKIGRLLSIIYTARFARTLSSLYVSGLSMLESVGIGATTIGNRYLAGQFAEVIARIKAGTVLSNAMDPVVGIDKKLIAAIYIGEETGRLDEMLLSVADQFEYESNAAIERLITYLEPTMIVIVAVLVCVLMLAVMLPLLSVYSTIG